MKVNLISNIYFQAHKLDYKPEVVKRNDKTGEYKPENVSMVEIDLDNPNDLKALNKLKEEWYDANLKYVFTPYNTLNYTDWIVRGANESAIKTKNCGIEKRYYAVTAQEENFESLDPKKILSICEMLIFLNGNAELFLIQSKSKLPSERNPLYKRCGSALSDGLKHYFNEITVFPVEKERQFYEANGFHYYKTDDNHMIWKREE